MAATSPASEKLFAEETPASAQPNGSVFAMDEDDEGFESADSPDLIERVPQTPTSDNNSGIFPGETSPSIFGISPFSMGSYIDSEASEDEKEEQQVPVARDLQQTYGFAEMMDADDEDGFNAGNDQPAQYYPVHSSLLPVINTTREELASFSEPVAHESLVELGVVKTCKEQVLLIQETQSIVTILKESAVAAQAVKSGLNEKDKKQKKKRKLLAVEPEEIVPIAEGTFFFFQNGRPLGKIAEVLGRVTQPFYTIRYESEEVMNEIFKSGDAALETIAGTKVFCAIKDEYFTKYMNVPQILQNLGSDASWEDDKEPPQSEMQYSDDEEEREAKRKKRKTREVFDPELGVIEIDEEDPENSASTTTTSSKSQRGRGRGRGRDREAGGRGRERGQRGRNKRSFRAEAVKTDQSDQEFAPTAPYMPFEHVSASTSSTDIVDFPNLNEDPANPSSPYVVPDSPIHQSIESSATGSSSHSFVPDSQEVEPLSALSSTPSQPLSGGSP